MIVLAQNCCHDSLQSSILLYDRIIITMPFYAAAAAAAAAVSAVVSLLIANGHSKQSRIASATASPQQRCI